MVQIGDTPNPELRIITSTFNKVLYKGKSLVRVNILTPPPKFVTRLNAIRFVFECKFLLNFCVIFYFDSPSRGESGVFTCCCLVARENKMQWIFVDFESSDVERRKCLFYADFNYAFIRFSFTGSSTQIRHLALRSLLPNTEQYMTYEGSTTHPGCWESTVWIIVNKPIYITKQEVIYTLTQKFEQTVVDGEIHENHFLSYTPCGGWCRDLNKLQKHL